MHEGDVWELYIPSELAYGASGTGKDIGPNSTLVFKVELIEILGGGDSGEADFPKTLKRKKGKGKTGQKPRFDMNGDEL